MATGDRSSARSGGAQPGLEAWAGIECTVNRVGDRFHDQLRRSGHHDRESDLELIAGLGFARVRYPILWERTAPGALADAAWAWPDARVARLRALGLPPIVTLVHHGSGPAHTSLVDPEFPARLAAYADAVARRYPDLEAYTPVNEPLTTARFAGLYGHWYPHGTDEATFVRCLLTECRATALAMRAIRAVNPAARLIQTEDLGRTHATPRLGRQAAFENERRWLSLDLLCGRVDRAHPLWPHLARLGIAEAELRWCADNPCPPDVLGFNYYLTSERWLDEDLARWPAWAHGGNGRDVYADVHATLAGRAVGLGPLLAEAWARYGRPLAVTECHLGSTREQQLRWIADTYDQLLALRARGVDVVAVTAWSVLGAYDWHCLVTRCEGAYEPGLFDVRGPAPRPTALAAAWAEIARGRRPSHPAVAGPGFWQVAPADAGEEAA